MRLKLFFSFLITAATNLAHSQALDVEWITNYGGSQWDHALATLVMPDSSLITTGYTYSDDFDISVNKGSADLFVSKQNLAGELEWIITFGGSNFDQGTCLVQASDSTFIVGGNIESNDGDVEMSYGARDIMLLKINLGGEIIWQKIYGGTSFQARKQMLENAKLAGVELTGSRTVNNVAVDMIQNEVRVIVTYSATIIEFTD